ncbi:MAG: FG-GAP repeat protein [Vicinamibacterales bacterium]
MAVVGAWRETVGSNAVQGSAYVFGFNGTSWVQRQRLVADDFQQACRPVRTAVAIHGTTIITVGAGKQNVPVPTTTTARPYIFVFNGATWVQQAKLVALDTVAGAGFAAVALHGDLAVVGASLGRPGGTGPRTGRAYVFERSGTTWTERALDGGDHADGDYFGDSVSVSGTTVCVGARRDTEGGVRTGSAYLFVKSGANWALQQKLVPAAGAESDYFGQSCSIDGETVAVGAPGEGAGAGGFGGVHVFTRTGTAWTLQQHLNPAGLPATAALGSDVALRGDLLVAGAASGGFPRGRVFLRTCRCRGLDRAAEGRTRPASPTTCSVTTSPRTAKPRSLALRTSLTASAGFVAIFRRTGHGRCARAAAEPAASVLGKSASLGRGTAPIRVQRRRPVTPWWHGRPAAA